MTANFSSAITGRSIQGSRGWETFDVNGGAVFSSSQFKVDIRQNKDRNDIALRA